MESSKPQAPSSNEAPNPNGGQKHNRTFVQDLYGSWCESAPYGDQVPDELPRLLRELCEKHSGKSDDEMHEAIMSMSSDDPMEQVIASIFTVAAQFTTDHFADAVYDRDGQTLHLIDLELLGVLATEKNDPNPSCEHQHIMHPDQGGRAVFVKRSKE